MSFEPVGKSGRVPGGAFDATGQMSQYLMLASTMRIAVPLIVLISADLSYSLTPSACSCTLQLILLEDRAGNLRPQRPHTGLRKTKTRCSDLATLPVCRRCGGGGGWYVVVQRPRSAAAPPPWWLRLASSSPYRPQYTIADRERARRSDLIAWLALGMFGVVLIVSQSPSTTRRRCRSILDLCSCSS